jgi:hypothetical protein
MLDPSKSNFISVSFSGGRHPLLGQFPFGTITYPGLFTQRFTAYPFLARLTNTTLQNRDCLCANHAFFNIFAHFCHYTPAALFAKRSI